MMTLPQRPPRYKTFPVQVAALLVLAALGAVAHVPVADDAEVRRLATPFAFATEPLFAPAVPPGVVHGVNQYAPQLQHYLHMIGASVAMGDLDGDGLPNDLCFTDIRSKSVVIAPAPGTGERYAPYAFDFGQAVDLRKQYPAMCKLLDANEDGLMDMLVGFEDRAPLLLLRKDVGQSAATPPLQDAFVVQELIEGGSAIIWSTLTTTTTDVDGDGHDDLVIGNYFRDGDPIHDPDANQYFEMNDGFNWAENGGTDRIMLWQSAVGGATPEAHYVDAGDVFPGKSENRWTLAIAAGDIDLDGLSDLYISNDHGPDQLLLNRSTPGEVHLVALEGERGFNTPRSFQLGHDTFKGMGADFADINNDGFFDIYVSNIGSDFALAETHFLWVSSDVEKRLARGVAPYDNRSVKLGVSHSAWGWESIFDDFDNDGVDELVQATGFMRGDEDSWCDLGNFSLMSDRLVRDPANWPYLPEGRDIDGWDPNPFFVRDERGVYVDLSAVLFPGLTPNSRSIATADVDGDGDLDMAVADLWSDSLFIRNDAPAPGAYLMLDVLHALGEQAWGVHSHPGLPRVGEGTPAVGALVRVLHPDGRKRMRQVDGGNGHAGQRSQEVHFGLGELPNDAQLAVEVTWRDRDGALHTNELSLTPGRYVVTLSPRTEPPPGVVAEMKAEAQEPIR